jgi:hypothetical protein
LYERVSGSIKETGKSSQTEKLWPTGTWLKHPTHSLP